METKTGSGEGGQRKTPEDFVREIKEPAGYAGHGEYLFDADQVTSIVEAYADQELASLREQLANEQQEIRQLREEKENMHNAHCRMLERRDKDLKQKEDENRELVRKIKNVIAGLREKETEWEDHSFDYAASKIESIFFSA